MLAVGYGTAAPEAVAGFVAARWDVGAVRRCVFVSRGFNDIYGVEAEGGRFVFRLSGRRARGAADVADETAFLAHLEGAGVPVAAAVGLRDGGLWTVAEMPEGAREAVLFRDAGGRAPGLESLEDARAQGAALAALHEAAAGYGGVGRYPLDAERLLHRPLAAVGALGFEVGALGALVGRLAARLAGVAPGLARLRLHGDCHGLNARILADGSSRVGRAVLFDFDDGGGGVPGV